MIASVYTTVVLLAGDCLANAVKPAVTAAPEKVSHPWYVKAVSDQVVNFCCLGGLMGGMGFGGGVSVVQPQASTITFSSLFTETYQTETATTLYTTIPGSVITIYGNAGSYVTSLVDQTYSAIVTPSAGSGGAAVSGTFTLNADSAAAPSITSVAAANGFMEEFEKVESYAHALAEAIVAPVQMTKMISSAYEAIMEHGFIHANQAVELVSQASEAYDALRSDPAYAPQREHLAAQPTPINIKKAVARATQSHSLGYALFMAEPSGKKAYSGMKALGEKFVKDFMQH